MQKSLLRQSAIIATAVLLVCACAETGHQAQPPPEPAPPPPVPVGQPAPVNAVTATRQLERASVEQLKAAKLMSAAPAAMAESYLAQGAMNAVNAPGDVLGAGRYAPFVQDRERYGHFDDNGVMRAAETPVSTFSIDVDTGAYANVRRFLKSGSLPRQDAVRVEEMINYFDYAYAPPADRSQPFSVHTEIAPTPWNAKTRLLRIGLQGWRPQGDLPPTNLVFLVDVSGSMNEPDKLPLVKSTLKLLAQQMTARDHVSLVVYAGNSGVVLEPTPGDQKAKILSALDRLEAGGSTNGGEGIRLAYAMAEQGFIKNGINRVMLATDGDFNVGTVDFQQLKNLIEEKRKSGVALSTLGFGTGNYNDQLMEQLADAGNGNYTYVDSIEEANRALVQSRAATLQTIAKDVKIQVEFNPAAVSEYRLIGYEDRLLKREDFNNDQVDAGEIGAGRAVTALYEISLAGQGGERVDSLRYGSDKVGNPAKADELAFLRLRYKAPDGDTSKLIEQPIHAADIKSSIAQASESFRFAAAVAGFGQVLRGGHYTEHFGYDDVLTLARGAMGPRGGDDHGWKGEFVQLVELAKSLGNVGMNGGKKGDCNPESGCG